MHLRDCAISRRTPAQGLHFIRPAWPTSAHFVKDSPVYRFRRTCRFFGSDLKKAPRAHLKMSLGTRVSFDSGIRNQYCHAISYAKNAEIGGCLDYYGARVIIAELFFTLTDIRARIPRLISSDAVLTERGSAG